MTVILVKAIPFLPLSGLRFYLSSMGFADPAMLYHNAKQIRKAIFQQSLNLDK